MQNPESGKGQVEKASIGSVGSNLTRARVLAIRLLAASAALALPFESDAKQALYEVTDGEITGGMVLNGLLNAKVKLADDSEQVISGWAVKVSKERLEDLEGQSITGKLVEGKIEPDGKLFSAKFELTDPIAITIETSCCGPGAKPKGVGPKAESKGQPRSVKPQESGYKLEPKLKPYDPGTFLVDNPNVESEKVRAGEDQGLPHSYEVKPGEEFTLHVTSGPKDLSLMLELYPKYDRDPKKDPIRRGETRDFDYDTDFEVVLDDKDHVVVPRKITIKGKPFPMSIKVTYNADGSKTASAVLNAPIKVGPIKIPANSGFHEVTVKIGSDATAYFVILKGASETESLAPFPALDRDTVDDPEMPAEFETPFKVWRDPGASNGYRLEFLADNLEVENGGGWRGFKVEIVPDGFPHLLVRLTKGEEGKNDFIVYESGRVTPEYFREWRGTFARKMPAVRSTDPTGSQEVQANFFVKPVVTITGSQTVTTYEAKLHNPEAFAHEVQCQVNHVMQQGSPVAANLFCREKTARKVDTDQESRYRAYRARLDTRPKALGDSGADRRYRLQKY